MATYILSINTRGIRYIGDYWVIASTDHEAKTTCKTIRLLPFERNIKILQGCSGNNFKFIGKIKGRCWSKKLAHKLKCSNVTGYFKHHALIHVTATFRLRLVTSVFFKGFKLHLELVSRLQIDQLIDVKRLVSFTVCKYIQNCCNNLFSLNKCQREITNEFLYHYYCLNIILFLAKRKLNCKVSSFIFCTQDTRNLKPTSLSSVLNVYRI